MLVLGGAVVEVLGREDESSKEDAVSGAAESLGHGLEPGPEPVEVDEGGHEGRHLDVGGDDELGDELLQGGQGAVFAADRSWRWCPGWGGVSGSGFLDGWYHHGWVARDDAGSGAGEVPDHCLVDSLVDKGLEGGGIELSSAEVG